MPEVGSLLMLFLGFNILIVHLQFDQYNIDNDSLLNVFRHYQADLLCGAKHHHERVVLGGKRSRERWWYKLTHVC